MKLSVCTMPPRCTATPQAFQGASRSEVAATSCLCTDSLEFLQIHRRNTGFQQYSGKWTLFADTETALNLSL